jgi:hypothetical protein
MRVVRFVLESLWVNVASSISIAIKRLFFVCLQAKLFGVSWSGAGNKKNWEVINNAAIIVVFFKCVSLNKEFFRFLLGKVLQKIFKRSSCSPS